MANPTFRFPNGKTAIRWSQIGRFQAFSTGVGVFNLRDKMVDWLPTSSETVARLIVDMLDKVWASNGRIPPDWSPLELENDKQQ